MTECADGQPILAGSWDANQSWEFFLTDTVPEPALCTAVSCVAIVPGGPQIVLARNHRGWEMLGGHIEPGETPEQALLRECLEEGGFVPEQYRLFGHRKVTSKAPAPHSQRDGYYPFPSSYIPHYIAISTLPLQPPSGEEIIESRLFELHELAALGSEHQRIIQAGLEVYTSQEGL